MVVKCPDCERYFNDEFRSTLCPHKTFPANDGKNNFKVHDDSYLSNNPPEKTDGQVPQDASRG